MDILRLLPDNEYQAAVNANAPTALNPFATIADIVVSGNGIFDVANDGGTVPATFEVNLTDTFSFNGGNVGIGTATPSERLSVEGNIEIPIANAYRIKDATSEYDFLKASQGIGGTNIMLGKGASGTDAGNGGFIAIGNNATSNGEGIAIGLSSSVGTSTFDGIAIGRSANIPNGGVRRIAIGRNATVTGNDSLALGANVTANAANQFRYGLAATNNIFDGQVGIGTTTPSEKLEVNGNANIYTTLTPTSTANPDFINLGGTFSNVEGDNLKLKLFDGGGFTAGLGHYSDGMFYKSADVNQRHSWFQGSASKVMEIAGGNLGIGTGATTPVSRLHSKTPVGTGAFSGLYVENGTPSFIVLDNGKVGIGTTTPSSKLEVDNGTNGDGFKLVSGTGIGSSLGFYTDITMEPNRTNSVSAQMTFRGDATNVNMAGLRISMVGAIAGTSPALDLVGSLNPTYGALTTKNGGVLFASQAGGNTDVFNYRSDTGGVGIGFLGLPNSKLFVLNQNPLANIVVFSDSTNTKQFNITEAGVASYTGTGVKMGIGTATPLKKLDVVGGSIISTNTLLDGLILNEYSGTLPNALTFAQGGTSTTIGATKFQLGVSNGNGQFMAGTVQGDAAIESSQKIFISAGGITATMVLDNSTQNVGIGTTTPTSKLTVNGDVETLTNSKGFVVLDRTNGNRYRIYTDGGVLNTELVP